MGRNFCLPFLQLGCNQLSGNPPRQPRHPFKALKWSCTILLFTTTLIFKGATPSHGPSINIIYHLKYSLYFLKHLIEVNAKYHTLYLTHLWS